MTLVGFVLEPAVSGILLGIGFAGLFLEMLTLSLVAGSVAAAALGLFFTLFIVSGNGDPLVISLAALGLLGMVIEMYVLPGFAVAGIAGVLSLIAAVILALGFPLVVVAMQALAVAVVVAVLLVVLAVRVVPERVFVRRLSVRDEPGAGAAPDYRSLLGRSGFTTSFLRPAGFAAIDGQRIDVLTEGEFVPAGTAVVVTRVEGARIFVRPEVVP